MRLRSLLVAAIACLAVVGGCDEDPGTDIVDQTWEVRYFVSNSSDQDLVVESAGPTGERELTLAAGEMSLLYDYSEFLGLPPDAGRVFWCISVRRLADNALVRQVCPVENAQWTLNEVRTYEHEYTLEITAGDIGPTVDSCPVLEGSVTELGTGDPVEGANVYIRYGLNSMAATDEHGAYLLNLPYGVPEAGIYVHAEGYVASTYSTQSSLTHVGGNVFRLDVELERESR